MFTGLVSECGRVSELIHGDQSAVLTISAPLLSSEIKKGDSISVNGICLTAIAVSESKFTADVMLQTLNMTSLKNMQVGTAVNLELAARVSDRLGGHIVQGHVDGVATIKSITPGEKWSQCDLEIPPDLQRYVVNQGSICIDGVSLTVGNIDDETSTLTVWLIPETLEQTNLGLKKSGDLVNIEVDVLAKYVQRLMERNQ